MPMPAGRSARQGLRAVGAFLLDAEGGEATIESVALVIAIIPFTVIPAACAKIMAEYYAYIAIVLGSPFM